MLTMVLRHVDQLRCLLHSPESSLDNSVRLTHESYHRAVRVAPGINIKKPDSFNRLNGTGDLPYNAHIPSFTEIRDTF